MVSKLKNIVASFILTIKSLGACLSSHVKKSIIKHYCWIYQFSRINIIWNWIFAFALCWCCSFWGTHISHITHLTHRSAWWPWSAFRVGAFWLPASRVWTIQTGWVAMSPLLPLWVSISIDLNCTPRLIVWILYGCACFICFSTKFEGKDTFFRASRSSFFLCTQKLYTQTRMEMPFRTFGEKDLMKHWKMIELFGKKPLPPLNADVICEWTPIIQVYESA